MNDWLATLRHDPLTPLLSSGNPALVYFARSDLLGEAVGPPEQIWHLKEVEKLLNKQLDSGAWKYPRGGREKSRLTEDYNQIETYRVLGYLVEKYGMNRSHPAVDKAARFLFSRQSDQGDFRGIYGNQYTPNYTGAIMELLIKAGYGADRRIEQSFRWLISARQHDGGWAIPMSTVGARWDVTTLGGPTLQPDLSRPFSHMVTGMVLRAFAAHNEYKISKEAVVAGNLLALRLFQRDTYPGRNTPEFWTKFSYPFWFTDLLSALDSLSQIGLGREEGRIQEALDWLVERQVPDGRWRLSLLRSGGDKQVELWVGFAICRLFKRLYI